MECTSSWKHPAGIATCPQRSISSHDILNNINLLNILERTKMIGIRSNLMTVALLALLISIPCLAKVKKTVVEKGDCSEIAKNGDRVHVNYIGTLDDGTKCVAGLGKSQVMLAAS